METRSTILIVDDDAAFCLMLTNMVGSLGYHVLTTLNASNVPYYELSDGDFVFIDIMMPGTDGFDALRILAKHNFICSVVLMSGSPARLAEAEKLAKKLEVKITGVLHKPFRLDDVKHVLEGI